ncbi:hypothetical protein EDC96DRAFT_545493 [Choanephora cucurbitarum]|nr:hypothetical protein EDC96DRAFT_545493 [Choanephora cucurbitarum]
MVDVCATNIAAIICRLRFLLMLQTFCVLGILCVTCCITLFATPFLFLGYIGFACTALSVNPSPDSTLLLVKSDRFYFCQAIHEFKRIVPLLHLSYNARCILKKNIATVVRSYQPPLQYTLRTKRLKE